MQTRQVRFFDRSRALRGLGESRLSFGDLPRFFQRLPPHESGFGNQCIGGVLGQHPREARGRLGMFLLPVLRPTQVGEGLAMKSGFVRPRGQFAEELLGEGEVPFRKSDSSQFVEGLAQFGRLRLKLAELCQIGD